MARNGLVFLIIKELQIDVLIGIKTQNGWGIEAVVNFLILYVYYYDQKLFNVLFGCQQYFIVYTLDAVMGG